jgi:uncharacterized protein (DUF4415 family)
MSGNKRGIATNLNALDAHAIKPDEYEDAPELTDEQLAEAVIRRGRPPLETRKQPVKIRLDPDLVAALRASGPGWQTRINALLRQKFKSELGAYGVRIKGKGKFKSRPIKERMRATAKNKLRKKTARQQPKKARA